MSIDPRLLARHLRQQAELGGAELYLHDVLPEELRAALRACVPEPLRVRESKPAGTARIGIYKI
jgi:hypothetical protein